MKPRTLLSILLYLIALHSFFVGLALIILPLPVLEHFGYNGYAGNFFKAQGGIFHIVMSIIYVIAARDVDKHRILIYLTLTAKFIATIFLLGYYFIFEQIWMVLVSGIGDFLMGLCVFLLWRGYQKRPDK
jgi:hypothetical protein